MLSKEQEDERSVARDDDSSNVAGNKKIVTGYENSDRLRHITRKPVTDNSTGFLLNKFAILPALLGNTSFDSG
ncbi:MAG: hypothetical protein WDN26_18540 [Chitinophagaceae bacterium]